MSPPYVFVSHASDDKKRLKPLIEALALQGLSLWIDRPGPGRNNFDFDREFIDRYAIRSLRTGSGWSDQISDAIRGAGAVLICLSRAVEQERRVLMQELLLGQHHKKLVACAIDDLPFDALPRDLGLPDASRIQAERIDLEALGRAVALERIQPKAAASADPDARDQWRVVERLIGEIDRLFDAAGTRVPGAAQMAAAREAVAAFPIGPIVRVFEIPAEVITVFADRLGQPERAAQFLTLAMELRLACNPEGFSDRQIAVRSSEVLNPRQVPAEEYWSVALSMAGLKSRRSLAALLLAPGAPRADGLPADVARVFTAFLQWLRDPQSHTSKEA